MSLDGPPDGYVPPLHIHKQLLDHALMMRTMTPQMVGLYLDKHLPHIEGWDRIWAINHYAGTKRRTRLAPKKHDSLFAAAVFMAGVSLGDLSLLFGIRKQTAAQKVHKHTTAEERATMRDRPPMIDLEALQLAKTIFDDALAQGMDYEDTEPLEIGRALIRAAHALVSAERGTDDFPDRPARYANRDISQPPPEPTPEPSPDTTLPTEGPLVSPAPNILNPAEADFLKGL